MASSSRRCLAGLVQMCSVNDVAQNLASASKLVHEAAGKGCRIVFLPECFSFIGAKAGEAQSIAEPLDGPTITEYKALAKRHKIWLSLGGFQEKCEGESRIYNTHVVIDELGTIQATYRKIHLYDVPMVGLVESKQALPGDLGLVACDSPCGRLGVTICTCSRKIKFILRVVSPPSLRRNCACAPPSRPAHLSLLFASVPVQSSVETGYDMRFPELYQKLTFVHGSQVLLMPAAFAMKTGEAHWETLLRARAIETQCYVVAAAQAGLHNTHGNQRCSWGHSLAIDPWGKVVASFGAEGTGVECFDIDLDLVDSTRANMPMAEHRRYDVYGDGPHERGGAAAAGVEQEGERTSPLVSDRSAMRALTGRWALGVLAPLAAVGVATIAARVWRAGGS